MASHSEERVAIIRTSDRGMFKSCRRRWNWQSALRHNLEPKQAASPLWLGSGFHFALEDWYGYRYWDKASDALRAYAKATTRVPNYNLPDDTPDLIELGAAMLDYYQYMWLQGRDPIPTYWLDGEPQVEVEFEFTVPMPQELLDKFELDRVVYQGHLDRVGILDGELWIIEYKTAKQYQWMHLETDAQVSAYCWAGTAIYDRPVRGVIYQQHKKVIPEEPPVLSSGRYSTNSQMITSHRLYKAALENLYGSISNAPTTNVNFLNKVAMSENEDQDAYVKRHRATRSDHYAQSEGTKIILELEEILDPNIALYPHHTRSCSYCPFMVPCIALDDGGDWEFELEELTRKRSKEFSGWRKYLETPEQQSSVLQV